MQWSEPMAMRMMIAFSLLFTAGAHGQQRVPVLIELFTSEGCSSCPPADSLLAELQKKQPVANVDVIVLSEHVDYWNSLGWKDPFSDKLFSQRQERYAQVHGSGDIYTPEAVIDGQFSAVGSQRQNVLKALTAAGAKAKDELKLSVRKEGSAVSIEAEEMAKGELWVAIAQSKAVSQVAHGENGGRTLQHVEVVRLLTKVNGKQARLEIDKAWGADLDVVAFVQDGGSGRVLQVMKQQLH
jgi:hypothetical protein